MTGDPDAPASPGPGSSEETEATPDREGRLRKAIDDLANQLCLSVDGDFDFAVHSRLADETLEKLAMLTNFVLDTARRGMSALRERNASLAAIDEAKTAFFSNVSHEFRTPLTLLLGPLEDALAQPHRSLGGDALAAAHRNALRLLKLVNALLEFSRIEAGRVKAVYVAIDLGALTADLSSTFRAAIERAGLRFVVDCPPDEEPAYVDRGMWETIVYNLLSNALKFTFDGEISVSLRRAGGCFQLEVRDTGEGIPEEELPRLFDRFHRVEGSRSRSHEGSGIGLALVRELVRLHGGTVEVASTVGKGTAFRVAVPRGSEHLPEDRLGGEPDAAMPGKDRAAAFVEEAMGWSAGAASPATRVTARGPAPGPRDGQLQRGGARVLVVDDNADMRAYVTRLLGEHWSVECASDGLEALEAARRDPPQLVLSDVMMPGLDGFELLRELRTDPRTAAIPIVLLSARAGEEARVEGLERGADDYLVKPFSGRELIARARTHIELAQLRLDADVIQRVAALLTARLDLEHIVQTLTDEATRVAGAEVGALFYDALDQQGARCMLRTLAGAPRDAWEQVPTARAIEVLHASFAGGGVVRVEDVTKDPRHAESTPFHPMYIPGGPLPVRSYLAVPVRSRGGEILGGLFFGHSRPGVFTERSERLLVAIASHAAIAIDNAQLYERAQAARREAEAASRAKDEFLAMLGHELRNPLAPIVTALHLMDLRGDESTGRERELIGRQVRHVVRLVDDLLDVSRITQGKVELKREPIALAHVVSKAIEMASPILEERKHRLSVSVDPRGLVVDADQVRLAQVVSNLVTNAAKYTEPGGNIAVTADAEDGHVVLRVRDDGVGISPETLPHVFDLFVQERQSSARSQGGLGLGLAIVRSLVSLHGGTVVAHSDGLGKGSELEVRLPAHVPTERTVNAPVGAAEAGASDARATGRRILVVDDNEDAAELLADALSALGYSTRVAHDGPAALREAADFRPEAALLDIGLPVMDGYELAERLRAVAGVDGTRLIAVTGYGQEADRARSRVAGFDAHLVKPVEVKRLTVLLDGLLEQGAPPPAS